MRMTSKVRIAVAGASGYAGGELLRLLLAHPEVEIGALTGALQRGGEARAPCSRTCLPLADRVLEPTSARDPGRPRRRLPRPPARSVRRDRPAARRRPWSSTAAPTSGSPTTADWERFYGGEHAGSWPYGLPELGDQRAHLDRRDAHRRPRLLPDRLEPRPRAGRRARASSTRPASWSSPPAAPAAPARRRSPTCSAPRSWAAPARTASAACTGTRRRSCRTSAALTDAEVKVSFTPLLVPMPRASWRPARHRRTVTASRGPGGLRDGVEGRALPAPAARGAVAADQVGRRAATPSTSQVTVDEAAGRLVAVAAVDNLTKGTAGAAVQCMNLALGLPETTGPLHDRARADERTLVKHAEQLGVAEAGARCRPARAGPAARHDPEHHRDRDGDVDRVHLRRDPEEGQARGTVHGVRGRGAARLRPDRRPERPAGRRWPRRRSRVFTLSTFDTDWILVPQPQGVRGGGGLATIRTHRPDRRPKTGTRE